MDESASGPARAVSSAALRDRTECEERSRAAAGGEGLGRRIDDRECARGIQFAHAAWRDAGCRAGTWTAFGYWALQFAGGEQYGDGHHYGVRAADQTCAYSR